MSESVATPESKPLRPRRGTGQVVAGYAVSLGLIGFTLAVLASPLYFSSDHVLELKVTAPEKVEAGETIVIDSSATEADSYAYTVNPPLPCRLFNDGTILVTSTAKGGDYLFIVTAAKDGRVGLAEIPITVAGGVPPPGPAGFAEKLRRAVESVESVGRSEQLLALTNGFATVASMVSAGILTDLEEIQDATLNLNEEALGSDREAWKPVRDLISAELQSRRAAGTLTTTEDHARVWREIAEALKNATA